MAGDDVTAGDEDKPRRAPAHAIGQALDALSVHDFDERIALLRAEIDRLEVAKRQKQAALDVAASVFRR
jgi:uncharacterized small protein (DUF1192 family)